MHKDDSPELSLETPSTKDDISNKEIVKKIFSYAIPFIIINVVSSCYNFIDLTLLIKFSAFSILFIGSCIMALLFSTTLFVN